MERSYQEAIGDAILQMMELDKRVFLLGEGVDNITGIYGTTLEAYKRFGPTRVIDVPLSENGLTGFAIGAALDGMRPVLFHQRNDFLLLSMDQLVNNAAKLHYISSGVHRIPLTIITFVARKVGEGAQHSQSLQALFAHIPGLKVVMPATPYDAKGLLAAAIQDDNPVIVLYHRTLFDLRGEVPGEFYTTPIGSARIVRQGRDVTVVSISATLPEAQRAADELKGQVDIELIDLRSIQPFDKEMILASVVKTGRFLAVDTGWPQFGITAELVACVSEEVYRLLKAAPRRIALPDVPAPATPYLLKYYHPSTNDIISSILEMLKRKTA